MTHQQERRPRVSGKVVSKEGRKKDAFGHVARPTIEYKIAALDLKPFPSLIPDAHYCSPVL